MADKLTQEQLLRLTYFSQSEHYVSDSKGSLIPIRVMERNHAANAARRLLADADTYAADSGQYTDAYGKVKSAAVWMIRQPLWQALVARAGGQ